MTFTYDPTKRLYAVTAMVTEKVDCMGCELVESVWEGPGGEL
jgi:hypothetical protein